MSLVDDLITEAALEPGMDVLVPHLGDGLLAYAVHRAGCTMLGMDDDRDNVRWFQPPFGPKGCNADLALFPLVDPALHAKFRRLHDRVMFIPPDRANAEAWEAHARHFLLPGGKVIRPR